MKRALLLTLMGAVLCHSADPVRSSWIMTPAGRPGSARFQPEVHSAIVNGDYVEIRSAGVSLKYFGPLQLAPIPSETAREFLFCIPLHPHQETGRHSRVPADMIGVFLNGLPIYNYVEALSWNGANLWHYDAVAGNDDGSFTAAGVPRVELTHPAPAGLLEQLIPNSVRHSPLIGFALDGYPVYGPWAYANADGSGELRRMRSSYRLRTVATRHDWSDGIRLTPEQYGPDVTPSDPLGTYSEDYEYVPGTGDLDSYNGRFAITPEYPNGTYAYYLTTDPQGRLAYPYLIGPRYYGHFAAAAESPMAILASGRLTLSANSTSIHAGKSVRLRLEARDAAQENIRAFEYVHERPIHLLVASADLAEFDHIHPELTAGDAYELDYAFAHGGRYRLWADYSLPGEPPRVESFDVEVQGPTRPAQKLVPISLTQSSASLTVKLDAAQTLRAGVDIPIALKLSGNTAELEPYLGAWAHVVISSEDLCTFAHAHPIESASVMSAIHTHVVSGPAPEAVHILTSFPKPGLYKLWAQFQQAGKVLTVPFVLRVEPAAAAAPKAVAIPPEALRVSIGQQGYSPAKLEIPAGRPVTIAFIRDNSPNCGSEVIFPKLNIRQAIPPGQTAVVQLPAQPAGEISFACGMGMFRGMIVAR